MTRYELRDYQLAASEAAVNCFKSPGRRNGLLVLPTGSGKSLICAEIARRLGKGVLILQPNKEILEQNFSKYESYGLGNGSMYSASVGKKEISEVTFATIGSIMSHVEDFDGFGAVIVDEAHCVNARGGQYADFLTRVRRKVVGMTATPYRLYSQQGIGTSNGHFLPNGSFAEEDYFINGYIPMEGVTVENACILKFLTRTRPRVFHDVLYSVSTRSLLERGFLSRLHYYDLSLVDAKRVSRNSTGRDYDDKSLQEEFNRCGLGEQLADIVRRLLRPKSGVPRKGILVFTRFIDEAERLSRAVDGVAVVTGELKKGERERLLRSFRSGRIKVVANVGVLTTGFDYPELDTIVMARPTMSLALWYQVVGRVIRPCAGKEAWVVDLGGNIKRFGKVEDLELSRKGSTDWHVVGVVGGRKKQLTNVYY